MRKLLILSLILGLTYFFGCSDSNDDKKVNEFETLVEYLEGTDGGYVNNMGSWILSAGVLKADFNYADYTVLDIRSAEAFSTMHIDGAINTTMSGMWDYAETSTKPLLVVCYSGQSASYAHMLLRLKGYEAYVMKFGMSSYDASLDTWTSKCVDTYAGDLVKTASPALPSFDYPELNTGKETAEEILDARVDAAVAAWGSMMTTASTVIASPSNYNIINYWPETDYLNYGHISGSYQVTPGTLTMDENLSALDPEGGNVFYCYTGQTAAAAIAYLYVIGYEDVKSISYGFNSMNWSALPGSKWPKPYGE